MYNLKIALDVWVRQVLNGNYRRYLEDPSAAYHQRRRLKILVAPSLLRFREFYQRNISDETYRKKGGSCYRVFTADETLWGMRSVQKKFDELNSEIDWLGNEYRSCISESYGMFAWKNIPGQNMPRPFFRLESAAKIKKLTELRDEVQPVGRVVYYFIRYVGAGARPQVKRYDALGKPPTVDESLVIMRTHHD